MINVDINKNILTDVNDKNSIQSFLRHFTCQPSLKSTNATEWSLSRAWTGGTRLGETGECWTNFHIFVSMDFVFKDNAESICRWKTGTLRTISSMTARVDELLVSIEKLKSWGRRTVHFAPWSGQIEPMHGAYWTNWQPCIHYRKLFIIQLSSVFLFIVWYTLMLVWFLQLRYIRSAYEATKTASVGEQLIW